MAKRFHGLWRGPFVRAIRDLSIGVQVIPFSRKERKQHGFLLQTQARTRLFVAPTKEVADDWVKAIEAVNGKKGETKPKSADPAKVPAPIKVSLSQHHRLFTPALAQARSF